MSAEEIIEIEEEDISSGQEVGIAHPFNPNDIEIDTPPFTIGYLIDMLEHGEINMNTDFQREGNLWSEEKQSRLIESALLGLPLPAFYFDTTHQPWDIIDGLQRCCCIDNFCVKKTLRLSGLEFLGEKDGHPYLDGAGFDDLDRTLQRSLIMRAITVNKIRKAPRDVRFILFRRLNTGGLELTPQEIRHAVYRGVPADVTKRLAKSESFKEATGGRIPTNRMQDSDFASRFIAFYLQSYKEYQPSLDDFINKSMEMLMQMDKSAIARMEHDFERAMHAAKLIFGDDAFRKRIDVTAARRPVNKAYFEVISVTFAQMADTELAQLTNQADLFKSNLMELMRSERYSHSLSGGTGTRDSVQVRFGWFNNVVTGTIMGKPIMISHDNEIKY